MQELDEAIDRHAEEAFAFLAELVAAPSTVGSEQGAVDVFARQLKRLGLDVESLDFPNGQYDDPRAGVSPDAAQVTDGRYQALGVTPGEGPLTLLLNGHIDVVPADASDPWTTDAFTPDIRGGRMYGRGTGDMKGGFAVGALALRALQDVAPDLFAEKRLGFLAVIEEECTGNGALRAANDGVLADEVLLLEPTDLGLLLGGVGVLWVDVDVVGVSAHAHEADAGRGAVELAMRLVDRLRTWTIGLADEFPPSEHLTDGEPYNLNLGTIAAGNWNSTAPATTTVGLRIGYPTAWTPERAEQEVRAEITRTVEADPAFPTQPTVRLTGFRAAGYEIDPNLPLVRDLAAAHTDAHGAEPMLYTLGSTTDARTYLNAFGVPAVCYGAVAHNMHGVDESVELQSIIDAAKTVARFLLMRFRGREATA